ncbi:MAG: hypothetical protein ABH822_00040 [Patescibacteria group bacterium]
MITTREVDIFFVRVREWDTDHVVLAFHDGRNEARILFMAYSFANPYDSERVMRIAKAFKGMGDCVFAPERSVVGNAAPLGKGVDCYWRSRSQQPHPGLYMAVGFKSEYHPSSESVVEFLCRETNLTIEEINKEETRSY